MKNSWRRHLTTYATLTALALLVVAMLLPPLTLQRQAQSFLVVFDITQSMGVADMTEDTGPQTRSLTRLDASKEAMRQVLRKLPCGSRVGWAAFADYRTMPLLEPIEVCEHFDALLSSLDFIEPRMRWANASNVAKGLYWSLRATETLSRAPSEDDTASNATAGTASELKNQPIITVFFSDGHEAPPMPLDPTDLLKLDKPLPGLIVGVGQTVASPIPRTDAQGRVIAYWQADEVVQRQDVPAGTSHEELSALDEPHLRAMAERHRLHYTRLSKADALHAAMREAGPSRMVSQPTDLKWIPTSLALLLLVLPYLMNALRLLAGPGRQAIARPLQ